jgi:hypothetical protein
MPHPQLPAGPPQAAPGPQEPSGFQCGLRHSGRDAAWLTVGGELDLVAAPYFARRLEDAHASARPPRHRPSPADHPGQQRPLRPRGSPSARAPVRTSPRAHPRTGTGRPALGDLRAIGPARDSRSPSYLTRTTTLRRCAPSRMSRTRAGLDTHSAPAAPAPDAVVCCGYVGGSPREKRPSRNAVRTVSYRYPGRPLDGRAACQP